MNREFNNAILTVSDFYQRYNDCFLKVNNLINELDDRTRRSVDKIKQIFELLRMFIESYCTDSVIPAHINNMGEVKNCTNKLYENLYDQFLENVQEPLKDDNLVCIHNILDFLLAQLAACDRHSKEDIDDYFYISIKLSKMIGGYILYISGVDPLNVWEFGGEKYSLLTAEEQLVLLLNKAIMVDRINFRCHDLSSILEQLNKILRSFYDLNWEIFYDAGLLNFKVHNYQISREYFLHIKNNIDVSELDVEQKKKYFHARLLIAYSYEYSKEFKEAITELIASPDCINSVLKRYDNKVIVMFQETFVEDVFKIAEDNSLIKCYFESDKPFLKQIIKSEEESDDLILSERMEIIHALAHCLNEYANATKKAENPNNPYCKFIFLARKLIKELAVLDPSYNTCYATMNGEAKNYDKALSILTATKEKQEIKNKETLVAETEFYLYYIKQMLGRDGSLEYDHFRKYADNYSDSDALCHILIFEFRNELRRYFTNLFNSLDVAISPMPLELQAKYTAICELTPTPYMNINVRHELRYMQRAFVCLQEFVNDLNGTSKGTHIKLLNACRRFLTVEKNVDIEDKNYVFSCLLSNTTHSISDSLFNIDSTFILAPISGVLVFQYQTGEIDQLVRSSDLLVNVKTIPELNLDRQEIVNSFVAQNRMHQYRKLSIDITSVNEIKQKCGIKDSGKIFFYQWESDEASKLYLFCDKDALSKVIMLVDVDEFSQGIKRLFGSDPSICRQRLCERYGRKCCVVMKQSMGAESIDWIENITDHDGNVIYYCLQKQEGDDVKVTILAVVDPVNKTELNKHDAHRFLNAVQLNGVNDEPECHDENLDGDEGKLQGDLEALVGGYAESGGSIDVEAIVRAVRQNIESKITEVRKMIMGNESTLKNLKAADSRYARISADLSQLNAMRDYLITLEAEIETALRRGTAVYKADVISATILFVKKSISDKVKVMSWEKINEKIKDSECI